MKMYWYPKCSTCKNAKKWFEQHGIDVEAIHIVESPPSKEELQQLHEKSGLELKKFFNTSGQKYRELGLKDKIKEMSTEEAYALLASDGMLIKRPLVSHDEQVTVGFNEKNFEEMWLSRV